MPAAAFGRGWPVMRGCWVALLCGVLAGCSASGVEQLPRMLSQAPTNAALERSVAAVGKTAKWAGMVEASPVRQAHQLAPADWIVCAQSGAHDLSPAYAMFFNGDTMVHYRIAVELDDCARVPYAPVATLTAPPPGAMAPLASAPQH